MAQLTASVVEGVLQQNNTAISTTNQKKTGTSELGKDAFLQLLVCQMQNQDPMNPSTDTQFVSQLATFSQLEQLQNLTSVTEQSQAFSLVGKNVMLSSEDSNGKAITVSGIVDFISVVGKKMKLSVNGSLYDLEQLQSVIDYDYVLEHSLPKVEKKIEVEYDASNPKDFSFEVNLGEEGYQADQVTLVLGEQVLDQKMITLNGNKVTVSKEALADLPNGVYWPTIAFNNPPYYTTATDMLQITVKNSTVTVETEAETETDQQQEENMEGVADS